ncbi:DUF3087 family protein [Shewanella maritima]|uniref:DUF3087 family protein n=1 Tax=Shewanella maritima TaxID=2520507 RepID=UPI00373642E9
MKLEQIDKQQYRSLNNKVQFSLVALLALLSVVIGQTLIVFFGSEALPDGSTGNFNLNFLGVIFALMICTFVVRKQRGKPQYFEVYYIWQLKQLQNKIFKNLKSIQSKADDNEPEALMILAFYYRSLALVYELDNNTLTMSKVNAQYQQVSDKMISLQLDPDVQHLDESVLANY